MAKMKGAAIVYARQLEGAAVTNPYYSILDHHVRVGVKQLVCANRQHAHVIAHSKLPQ
jgi:hypothetical protein